MKWERRIGQVIAVLAIAALLGVVWGLFLGATLWALAELGALDGNHTAARALALTWMFWAAFALLTTSHNLGATLQRKLRSQDLPLTQLRNSLLEREAKLRSEEETRH
jgi:H+/Cl- antiporter ClcA